MAGERFHGGQGLYTPGIHRTLVVGGVIEPDLNPAPNGAGLSASDPIATRGLTLLQITAIRLVAGAEYTIQGCDWTDEDVVLLGLSDAERWIDIQTITQDALGDGAPSNRGKLNWTDHCLFIRIVATAPDAACCIKFQALGEV